MTTKKKATKKTATEAKAPKASPKTPAKPASAKAGKKAATAPAPKPGAARANTAAAAPAPTRRVKATKLSAMQAAVKVLADAPPEGLGTKDMVKAMAERKLWTSPGGKTPEASLYASIIREIARKGEEARFRKVSRGRFVLR